MVQHPKPLPEPFGHGSPCAEPCPPWPLAHYHGQSRFLSLIVLLATFFVLASSAAAGSWDVHQSGSQIDINYYNGVTDPQYAVLDLSSGYMRMNYGPTSGWGTSVDVMPCFWTGGNLIQGYGVTAEYATAGNDLRLTVDGAADGVSTNATVLFAPPGGSQFQAQVSATTTGNVTLDNRPGEAFKPVFLSSMHDSGTSWDASSAFYGSTSVGIPSGGWLVGPSPEVDSTRFGLYGGTSSWKTNAPTTTIDLSSGLQIAGWVTTDTNPNDDNVGYWAASDYVLGSWQYTVTSAAGLPTPEPCTLGPFVVGALGVVALARRRRRLS